MANSEVNLSGAALAIALVALLTALGQLLGQYFSTADGYRRCQKSVMGEYAMKTRRVWRWREFRFETLFVTPEIFLTGDCAPVRRSQVLITGSQTSRIQTLIPRVLENSQNQNGIVHHFPPRNRNGSDQVHDQEAVQSKMRDTSEPNLTALSHTITQQSEMVSWLPLLNWMHESVLSALDDKQQPADPASANGSTNLLLRDVRLPALIFRERSWDFQPPEVARPLAKTTLSAIAVMARRMGMKWKEFRPSDGILRAEGHSHIITSTMVRSLGIVLHYSYTGKGTRMKMATENHHGRRFIGSVRDEDTEIYIPRAAADRLGCGVIRTDPKLGLPDFAVSTQSDIVHALSYLDRSGASPNLLSKRLQENPGFTFRVADIAALTTSEIRMPGSNLVQVPGPGDDLRGFTTSSVGRWAFRRCLEEYLVVHHQDAGIQTQRALQICNDIGSAFAAWDHYDKFSTDTEQWVVTRDARYLDAVQSVLSSLTDTIQEMELQYPNFRYWNLLGIHIRVAMFAEAGEHSISQRWGTDYKADVDGYFRALPQIVDEMRKTGFYDRELIVDAWVTMMLRAMCWGAMHFFVPGERVPVEYYGSQLPVYIG